MISIDLLFIWYRVQLFFFIFALSFFCMLCCFCEFFMCRFGAIKGSNTRSTARRYYHPRMRCGYVLTRICLLVCHAVTFESLDVESSCLLYRYIFRRSGSRSYSKVIGSRSRSRSQEQKRVSVYLFAVDLPSAERQSCFELYANV